MLSSEIERQNKKLGNREKEIALLTEKVADQDARIEELLKIENDKYQLENKVAMLASEIER
jgi:Tfp pilus assembly protein PilN